MKDVYGVALGAIINGNNVAIRSMRMGLGFNSLTVELSGKLE